MSNSYKPGGGNKPQPYIPAGNGEKSGEYASKDTTPVIKQKKGVLNCYIKNIKGAFNFYNSKLVKKVSAIPQIAKNDTSIPRTHIPNSVVKRLLNSYVVSERYYNERGEAYLDIHYTCHGNPKRHPYVPHIHRWVKNKTGDLEIGKWEVFQ